MNVLNLFRVSYWFSQPLIARDGLRLVFWAVFLVLVVATVVFYALKYREIDRLYKSFWTKLVRLSLGSAVLFGLWFCFRQERVAFLSWRFWLVLGFAYLVYRGYKIYIYYTKRIPEIRAQSTQKMIKDKYLPKRKK